MKKPNLSQAVELVKNATAKHSPEILTGIGIAGMIITTVMAVRATPKALIIIEEKRRLNKELTMMSENGKIHYSGPRPFGEIRPLEVAKVTWKCYIPALITGTVSVACLIGASSVNIKRNAALATAYTLSESTLKEYQKKVVETVGEKKEQTIRDEVAKERIEKNPVSSKEVIITKKGNTLCLDYVSGRYFKSDIETIKKTVNELNRRMRDEMYISLNEFYYEIGLPPNGAGDDLGWNIANGYIDPDFSSQLAADETPCLVISYLVGPRYDYRNNY